MMIGKLLARLPALGATLALSTLVAGCAADVLRTAPPELGWRGAVSPVTPTARVWGDQAPADVAIRTAGILDEAIERVLTAEAQGEEDKVTFLALSGGAADGAYGAGVLIGWSERGDRPKFDVVTGVSTGALIAPFAFVGEEYNPQLKALFTETSTDDLLIFAPLRALTGGLGLVDVTPFEDEIAKHITMEFMAKVAKEHLAGRRLLIATTNLDARQPVIWDLGEIALRGDEAALRLFRKVMLASASIPGAFPPVYFDVEIDGERYQEMHVDGGVAMSVFIAPTWLQLEPQIADALMGRTVVYVIQNNKIVPNYGPAEDKLVTIASTSISEMIRTQARGDQLRIFTIAQRNGFDYRVTFVPTEFTFEEQELFDPIYMQALFEVGLMRGRDGDAWLDEPPALPSTLRAREEAEAPEMETPFAIE